MDIQLLIILIGIGIIALGIGFLLGRWLITRKIGPKLEFASKQYNRSKDQLHQSNSALMQNKKELALFKKTSVKEFKKLNAALELTKKDLTQAQADVAKARTIASTESAQSTEKPGTDGRNSDEHADDFFSAETNDDNENASDTFSKTEVGQESNGTLQEQEALINQYIEEAQKQQCKIDDLLAENEALQQSLEQAKDVAQSDDSLAQSPTDTQADFEGFVGIDAT